MSKSLTKISQGYVKKKKKIYEHYVKKEEEVTNMCIFWFLFSKFI